MRGRSPPRLRTHVTAVLNAGRLLKAASKDAAGRKDADASDAPSEATPVGLNLRSASTSEGSVLGCANEEQASRAKKSNQINASFSLKTDRKETQDSVRS